MSNTNRDGEIISASVTLLTLPTVFVALRMVSRHISRAGFGWDDLTVIIAMILSWGPNIINILASRHSLGHHTKDPAQANTILIPLFQYFYAFIILYSLSISFLKFSVILFQYRIFPVPSFRRLLCCCGVFVVAFETASTIVFIVPCTPIREFWITVAGNFPSTAGGRCIHLVAWLLTNGSINTVTDFVLLIFPLPMIWCLRASTLQRFILTGIFITGLMVTAVSMVRLVVIARYHRGSNWDPAFDFVQTCIWTAAEPSIAVVSACLPSLRPLIVRVIWGGAWRADSGRSEYLISDNTSSSWRGGSKVHDGNFSRLPESGKGTWANDVAVCGGRVLEGTEEEVVELRSPREETPIDRIRAKTTITLTISERVDWRDDLF